MEDGSVEDDCGVKERHFLSGPLCCELDSWVEGVHFLKELLQQFFAVVPDCEDVVYVPPPDGWSVHCVLEQVFL